jgi:hypothetical protein
MATAAQPLADCYELQLKLRDPLTRLASLATLSPPGRGKEPTAIALPSPHGRQRSNFDDRVAREFGIDFETPSRHRSVPVPRELKDSAQ